MPRHQAAEQERAQDRVVVKRAALSKYTLHTYKFMHLANPASIKLVLLMFCFDSILKIGDYLKLTANRNRNSLKGFKRDLKLDHGELALRADRHRVAVSSVMGLHLNIPAAWTLNSCRVV